jgi:hypothetical protein
VHGRVSLERKIDGRRECDSATAKEEQRMKGRESD